MQRMPIHRGGIVSAGYDAATRSLDIEFDTHRVVRYSDVGSEVAERFLTSAAPVSYFHDEIEDQYSSTELGVKSLKDIVAPAPQKSKQALDALKKLFGDA